MENEIHLHVYFHHPDGWFQGSWSVWVREWAALPALLSREMVMHNFWLLLYMKAFMSSTEFEGFHVTCSSNLRYLVFPREAWVPSGIAETRQCTIKQSGLPWP